MRGAHHRPRESRRAPRQRTLTQIADELGFADTGGFIRAFRRWTGVAPGVYRRQRT